MSGKRYSEVHTIPYFLCDRKDELTMPMLVNFLIMISGRQNNDLNIDEEAFKEKGYGWIILQYEFDIGRMPKSNEKVKIETEAVAYNRLFCYRNFYVYDENSEEIVTVKSIFALMNRDKRKIIRLPEEVIAPYEADYEKRIRRVTQPKAIDIEDSEADLMQKAYNVRYFDIDENDHVNNSHYLAWTLDALPNDFLSRYQINHGIIKFSKEIFENQKVDSYAVLEKEGQEMTSVHKVQVGETENCIAEFNWEKVN